LVGFWLRRARLQPADVRDVFQDTFQAIAAGIGQFEKTRPTDSFRAWIRTITQHKLADHFRRQGAQPAAVGGSEALRRLDELEGRPQSKADASEDEVLQQLRVRAMELIRGEFEPKTWTMFWRVVVEGQDAGNVAADLGVSPSAVRLAKSRVLRRLREELSGLDEL